MLDFIWDFLYRYYVVPGYNLVNTLTYGIVLGLIVFYLIPRLRKFMPRINLVFCISLAPFILFGATTRELVDHGLGLYSGYSVYPQNFFLVSPWIYFTMFFITSVSLIFSLEVQKRLRIAYYKILFPIGCILFLYNSYLIALNTRTLEPLALIFISLFIVTGFLLLLIKFLKLDFMLYERNYLVALAHLFDASTTFVGIDFYGNIEQHVVPNLFIGIFHTAAVMFLLKLVVLIPALYVIDKELKGDEFGRHFTKLVIVILGLGPGLRNTALMILH